MVPVWPRVRPGCILRTQSSRLAIRRLTSRQTLDLARQGDERKIALMIFPELGISAYAIDDLLFQDALLDRVERGIVEIAEASRDFFPVLVVGAPLRRNGQLFNCAIVIYRGAILGVVPKSYLPNYREFYERRHFASGAAIRNAVIEVGGQSVPFGTDLLFKSRGSVPFTAHVEICEDVWVPEPPSTAAALGGAEILLNLSASNIVIGKAEARRLLCASQSARCIAAYAYSAAGPGESTTDLAWDGQAAIFEYGRCLAETDRFSTAPTMAVADVDLALLRQERMRVGTFSDCVGWNRECGRGIPHGVPQSRRTRRQSCSFCAPSIVSLTCHRIRSDCRRTATRPTTFRSRD